MQLLSIWMIYYGHFPLFSLLYIKQGLWRLANRHSTPTSRPFVPFMQRHTSRCHIQYIFKLLTRLKLYVFFLLYNKTWAPPLGLSSYEPCKYFRWWTRHTLYAYPDIKDKPRILLGVNKALIINSLHSMINNKYTIRLAQCYLLRFFASFMLLLHNCFIRLESTYPKKYE